ncbi:hypothetical protein [Bradyrhizobium erythrophlei]|uniref:Uncharacterized protein n=1 Tax=Bradyrhizobium erythrophlei TaxID=1437360 RepID=A0A1M5H369_9BRAD|nr:hypothetical protein [Bradyrhizobium erythrophlei]SHG10471.1 hypothetical protein SAMN05443248_0300 [Bradyrhizobium erythrophlei]
MVEYIDPVLAVGDDLARRGVKASAVAEACQQVSQDIIARKWVHIEGVPVFKVDGRPAQTVIQYDDQLLKDKPHYLYEEHVVDDADVTFLGDGKKRTLRDAGDFIKKYGEAHYHAVKEQYGCDDSLRAGVKPGTAPAAADRSPGNNPYALGGDPAKRQERIIGLLKSNARLAANLAKVAGCRIDGTPIPGRA